MTVTRSARDASEPPIISALIATLACSIVPSKMALVSARMDTMKMVLIVAHYVMCHARLVQDLALLCASLVSQHISGMLTPALLVPALMAIITMVHPYAAHVTTPA